MKTKNIITASILLVVAIMLGSLVATYFSYNNREIALRQQAEAQRGKIEGVHDKMWKIIQQKAQITDEYRQTFEKIYPQRTPRRKEPQTNHQAVQRRGYGD